jgi:hypothetical protein
MRFTTSLNYSVCMSAVLLLAACTTADEVVDTIEAAQERTKIKTLLTQEKLKKMFTFNPKQPVREVPHSYCYQVMQDIMCYNQQIPGAEYRLVGWQGTGDAPTPVIRPLTQTEKATLSRTPVAGGARLKPLEPIFVGKLPETKGTETKVQINETSDGKIF